MHLPLSSHFAKAPGMLFITNRISLVGKSQFHSIECVDSAAFAGLLVLFYKKLFYKKVVLNWSRSKENSIRGVVAEEQGTMAPNFSTSSDFRKI